jgi:zinc/manganese transport system substrate-binding protein
MIAAEGSMSSTIGRRRFGALLAASLAVPARPLRARAPLNIVVSFSVLADLVREVAGDAARVHALVGADVDAHGYDPTPSDARSVAAADIVVVNGLAFDGWAEKLARASGFKGRLVVATKGMTTLRGQAHGHGHGHAHSHGRAAQDPHVWQDPLRVRQMVSHLAEELAAVDPANAATYRARAEAYGLRLAELDAWIVAELASIPASRRKIVTSHDAFAYFKARYGIDFKAPRGVNLDAEPSAADIARLIREIRRENVRIVFLENVSSPRLSEQIARESGAQMGGRLFTDALSAPDGPAPSYLALMRHNVVRLRDAMLAE